MRIVIVNWARAAEGAANGGGANVYAQQLALELVGLGHEVLWLSGGLTYLPEPATGQVGPCKIRRMKDFHNIRTFEVFNSPVLAPGPCQGREPLGEISSPVLEAEVTRFFQTVKPEVVHFHNIEGFSCACVDAARAGTGAWRGARVFFSLHNYHTICPQVYLMKGGRLPCHDFSGGKDCEACMSPFRETHAEKAHRASYHMPHVEPAQPVPLLKERLAQVFTPPPPKPLPQIDWPGLPVEADIAPQVAAEVAATTPGGTDACAGDAVLDPSSPEWQPLANDPHPDPSMQGPLNAYGERRLAMVNMLSRCDKVIGVSRFVTAKFAALGVNPRVLMTLPIGSRMTELARNACQGDHAAPSLSSRPIRAVFLGYNNYYKGLHMLCDALELMEPEPLSRLHLCVYAKAVEESESRLNQLEPRLAGLSIRSGYRYEDIPLLLQHKDVGLVPSVWWDNGPQTVMEFFACGLPVIAAELGGIPDMVRHGHNGLLHRGNDRLALAAVLTGVARDPGQLKALRRNVRPPATMAEHALEMETLYRGGRA